VLLAHLGLTDHVALGVLSGLRSRLLSAHVVMYYEWRLTLQ